MKRLKMCALTHTAPPLHVYVSYRNAQTPAGATFGWDFWIANLQLLPTYTALGMPRSLSFNITNASPLPEVETTLLGQLKHIH